MKYLVEIIYKNALTPAYQYYNTDSDFDQMILESNNIEDIKVYSLDNEKTKIAKKLLRKNNN